MNWVCLNDYFQLFMCFVRKRININVTLVSESYVLLYYEATVYMLYINKMCLSQPMSISIGQLYRFHGVTLFIDMAISIYEFETAQHEHV